MLNFGMIFCVLLLLSKFCVCSNYVVMKLYKSNVCSTESYVGSWIFSLNEDLCIPQPFGVFSKYGIQDDSVKITTFGTANCSIEGVKSMLYYSTVDELCWSLNYSSSHIDYHGVFSIESDFPVDISTSKEYVHFEYFAGQDCRTPYVTRSISADMSNITTKTGIRLNKYTQIQLTDGIENLYHCTDEWYLRALTNEDLNITTWKLMPFSSGECVRRNNESLYEVFDSLKMYCMNSEGFEEIDKSLIHDSVAHYFVRSYHFDEQCSQNFSVNRFPLKWCSGSYYRSVMDTKHIVTRYYENLDCTGELLFVTTLSYDVLYAHNTCRVLEIGAIGIDPPLIVHYIDQFLDFAHYPDQVALIDGDICEDGFVNEKLTKQEILEIDHRRVVTFFSSSYCINEKRFALGKIRFPHNMQSFRVRCSQGLLYGTNHTQSPSCDGYFEKIERPFCVPVGVDGEGVFKRYFQIVCIPLYCGIYTEFDSRVCNGRGSCIDFDYCSCEGGYEGPDCGEWSCNGRKRTDEDVCSSLGSCDSPNNCNCDEGIVGSDCSRNVVTDTAIFLIIFGFGIFFCALNVVFIGCALCCFICGLTICSGIAIILAVCGVNMFQKRRLSRFKKLDDFEVLLQEQLLEKDNVKATLKINKSLFEIPYDEVIVKRMIGSGGSDAKVFLASWKNVKVAFKCFKTRRICSSQENFDQFEAEVNLLVNINHPNIIRFFGATLKPPRVGILMEFCDFGEILDFYVKYREKNNIGYPIEEKIRMIKGIIYALEYIHSRSIIHRDIKPQNILVDSSEVCKLMDFGISKIINQSEQENQTKRVGTEFYMAPEVVTGKYDHKCDSFSFSILLWVLFVEDELPYGKNAYNVEIRVANDPNFRPDEKRMQLDEEYNWIKSLMVTCWNQDPAIRYDFSTISKMFEREHIIGVVKNASAYGKVKQSKSEVSIANTLLLEERERNNKLELKIKELEERYEALEEQNNVLEEKMAEKLKKYGE